MPYLVRELLSGRPKPVTTMEEESLEVALERMRLGDFSQLPVVDAGGTPKGLLSHYSVLRAVQYQARLPSQLLVRDAFEASPVTYSSDEDLFDLLDDLAQSYAVLIVEEDRRLSGIVTSYDATEFFRAKYEDQMVVEDIEATIKELILASVDRLASGPNGTPLDVVVADVLSEDKKQQKSFREFLARYLQASGVSQQVDDAALRNASSQMAKDRKTVPNFQKLSLGQYIQLLLSDPVWPQVEQSLSIDREALSRMLERVRETRNALAHFRGIPTSYDRDQLRYASEQLGRNKRRSASITSAQPKAATDSVASLDEVDEGAELFAVDDSRYAKLAAWLQKQPARFNQVGLTLEEIEKIIGDKLPPSARKHRAWWANDSVSHPQSRLWMDVGWRIESAAIADGIVSFRRTPERSAAYAQFYEGLLSALRKAAEFPLRNARPDGSSWVWVADVRWKGAVIGHFGFSFALKRRFRVELYIDGGEAKANKAFFDLLHKSRTIIETGVGMELSWERLDDKRASRVAAYASGAITDDPDQLGRLRSWGLKTLLAFRNAVDDVLGKL